MAIWPFGRRNKRHTIHVDAPESVEVQAPGSVPENDTLMTMAAKPARTQSKRQKNRYSQPVEDVPNPLHDAPPPTSNRTRSYPQASDTEQLSPNKNHRDSPSQRNRHIDDLTSHSSAGQDQRNMSRNASAANAKAGDNGPAVLKKRLSKRKANAIAREQHIRLLSTAPIDIPRRGGNSVPPSRRGQPRNRHSDRYLSDVSLSARNSAASSMTDITETYKFKVNAFAALTPRPAVRHIEPPPSTARSQNPSAASMRRETVPNLPMTEENYYTKKRVDRLADNLDAGGLRELLERDRRRREKQEMDDQRRLQRRLERRAERQRLEEERRQNENPAEIQNEKADNGDRDVDRANGDAPRDDEVTAPVLKGPASGVGEAPKEIRRSENASLESVNAIGSLDDRSNREQNLRQRRSFAPSQDMGMSRSTLSRSSLRHVISTPGSSQIYGLSRGSTSMDAERRISDQGRRRLNPFSSLIRRGSSRLKRRYQERFHEQRSDIPNPASHESFFRTPAPSSAPSAPSGFIPPRPFLSSSTINRPHSRFTEHFGDGPLSPPGSRLQSPDIPEEPVIPSGSKSKVHTDDNSTGFDALSDGAGGRVRSWGPDGPDVETESNVPLSQSLASIDSEGSWMSGEFLRRISQRTPNHTQHSVGSLKSKLEEQGRSPAVDNSREDEQFAQFTPNAEEARDTVQDARQASSNVISQQDQEADQTLHGDTRKRPVLVTPTNRPKSNEGMLKDIQSLSPISAEESSPIEPLSAEFHQAPSINSDGEHGR